MRDFQFGDVVEYEEKSFVFLVLTADVLFLAHVFPKRRSEELQDLLARRGTIGSTALTYIMLTTEDFEDNMCSLGSPDFSFYAQQLLKKTKYSLNTADSKALKKLIASGNASPKLQKAIKQSTK